MIDFHSHILPEVDDGPKDVDESLKIIRSLAGMGFTKLVMTPHIDPQNAEKKIADITAKFIDVKKCFATLEDMPELLLGSEIVLDPALFNITLEKPLCFELFGKKYQLIEIYPLIYPGAFEVYLEYSQKHGITPIIAHIERYSDILKNTALISRLKDRGFLFQVDLISFSKKSSPAFSNNAKTLLQKNLADILSSDCHSFEDIGYIKEGIDSVKDFTRDWEKYFNVKGN